MQIIFIYARFSCICLAYKDTLIAVENELCSLFARILILVYIRPLRPLMRFPVVENELKITQNGDIPLNWTLVFLNFISISTTQLPERCTGAFNPNERQASRLKLISSRWS